MIRKYQLLLFCTLLGGYVRAQYDSDYVNYSYVTLGGKADSCSVVEMMRSGERVKVKYFADKDASGKTPYQRYQNWSKTKSIIAVSSGTYYAEGNLKPVGICMDDGVIINRKEEDMDGLVIIYKTGGIVTSDLDEGNLSVKDEDGTSLTLNLRNQFDREKFFEWGKRNYATVFQTHLLYFRDQIRVNSNGSSKMRERRFLAAAIDDYGKLKYFIINLINYHTLYDATKKTVDYLKSKVDKIVFMVNLDPGAQDYYEVRKPDGEKFRHSKEGKSFFQGNLPIEATKNLLVFYFE